MRGSLTTPQRAAFGFIALTAFGWVSVRPAAADQIIFSGIISQSTENGTGPAVNNPALNGILTGDAYSVKLIFPGAITAPSGSPIDLTGSSLLFLDPANSVLENSFDTISFSVIANGTFIDFSLLGCLTTGGSCGVGNFISANWRILASELNSAAAVSATGLDQPHPLDLLEDDGVTDIQGTIESYSYLSAVPEPASSLLMASGFLAILAAWCRQRHR